MALTSGFAKTGIEIFCPLNCAQQAATGAAETERRYVMEVRIMGKPEEVEAFAAELELLRRWEVASESRDYANRGDDDRVRRYIKVERAGE